MNETLLTVTELWIYPVKSLAGITLSSSNMLQTGLQYDRMFMLIMPNDRCMTQRQFPQMALIKTSLADNSLVFSKQGMQNLTIPFSEPPNSTASTTVWRDNCEVECFSEESWGWFQQALSVDFRPRLVRMKKDFKRQLNKPERYGADASCLFADAAPYLVANQSSLDALNAVLSQQGEAEVPMNRFRPNIVLSGLNAFQEHELSSINNQHFTLKLCYPCERCVMTTIDQQTASKHPDMEPFNTLREINPMPGKNAPAFAENAILGVGHGSKIHLGDQLALNSSGITTVKS